jgi:hypothetical protein
VALEALSARRGDWLAMWRLLRRGWADPGGAELEPLLERVGLDAPSGLKERAYRALVTSALRDHVLDGQRPLFG